MTTPDAFDDALPHVALAWTSTSRSAAKDATVFELVATSGAETNGICSNPFLESAFKTLEYRVRITINPDSSWAYDQDTMLMVRGQSEPFRQ